MEQRTQPFTPSSCQLLTPMSFWGLLKAGRKRQTVLAPCFNVPLINKVGRVLLLWWKGRIYSVVFFLVSYYRSFWNRACFLTKPCSKGKISLYRALHSTEKNISIENCRNEQVLWLLVFQTLLWILLFLLLTYEIECLHKSMWHNPAGFGASIKTDLQYLTSFEGQLGWLATCCCRLSEPPGLCAVCEQHLCTRCFSA